MLVSALAVAACGSSSSSSSSVGANTGAAAPAAATSSSKTTAAAASCGAIPTRMPADPNGVLANLPASVRAGYDLYPQAVHASAWSNWKPKHAPPYTLYFSPGNTVTPFVQDAINEFNVLKRSGVINKVIVQDSNNSVQTQIQQLEQAIREHVDIMVVLPLSAAGVRPVLESAGKAGIPVIAPQNASSSAYVIGLNGNTEQPGAILAQGLVQELGGKGNILDVHGIPGIDEDTGLFQGASAVLQSCPNIKTVGSVVGQFTPSVAKTATLEFLASHPQQIDGAIDAGGMATAVLEAFLQTGRKVATVADDGAAPGMLAYWAAHRRTYKGVAVGVPPKALADGTWSLAVGLLQGRGIKISDVSQAPPQVTATNLSQWLQPGWTLNTPIAFAPLPASLSWYSPSYLDNFFVKPASGSS